MAPQTGEYDEWAISIRDRLRNLCVSDDLPYRTLTLMAAVGMTSDDRALFAGLVQDWLTALLLPDAEAHDWAESLVDAIAQARAEVVDARQRKGLKQIKVRELARADAKIVALERRTRRRLNPPAPASKKRKAPATGAAITTATLATRRRPNAAAAKAGKRDRDTGGPRRVDDRNKKPCAKYKADKRKEHPDEGTDTQDSETTDAETDTDTPHKRTCRNCKADKHKRDTEDDTDEDMDQSTSRRPKRACNRHKCDKRKRAPGTHGATQGRHKTANTRKTADKRKHDRGSQQGALPPTARQLRAKTRAQLSDGTTNLEPD